MMPSAICILPMDCQLVHAMVAVAVSLVKSADVATKSPLVASKCISTSTETAPGPARKVLKSPKISMIPLHVPRGLFLIMAPVQLLGAGPPSGADVAYCSPSGSVGVGTTG